MKAAARFCSPRPSSGQVAFIFADHDQRKHCNRRQEAAEDEPDSRIPAKIPGQQGTHSTADGSSDHEPDQFLGHRILRRQNQIHSALRALDTRIAWRLASRDLRERAAMRISHLDFGILVLYLAGITLFGARFRRSQHTLRDYFLGGRTAPWWALACSIVATETSSLTIISTPGIAFATNLGFLQLVIGYLIARVVICAVFIPQYFRREFYTAYQLIEKRFGMRMKAFAATIFLVTRALAEGVRISAIGKVVSVAFGMGDRASIIVITLLTVFYTFEGGMTAVIWTDVLQLGLYLTGSLAAFFLLLHRIPNGWPAVVSAAAAAGGKLRIFDFTFSLTRNYTFWSGVIGGTFLTMASHGTDQTMVQRLLAGRSERDSKTALLASGVIIFVQFSLFLVIGVMLFVFAQHFALPIPAGDPDRIFPEFIVSQMPMGLAGLVLAAIFAVAMSNASGSLNSLASSSILDLSALRGTSRKGSAEADQTTLLRNSRRVTIVWGIVLGCFGLVHWGPVLEAGLTIASITYGSMLGLFLLGMWNRRATAGGAATGMVVGLATMLGVEFLTPLAWTWFVLVGTLVTFAAGSLASLIGGASGTPTWKVDSLNENE
jgi:solute:Na+ symporter, SSS family